MPKRMTNRDKFIAVFGFEPDCDNCNPYPCDKNCEYRQRCFDGELLTPCHDWWNLKYHRRKANETE